jgi:MFS family permease
MSSTVQASKADCAASNSINPQTIPKLPDDDPSATAGDMEVSPDKLSTLRPSIILFSLALALFLSSLETSIVATAVVSVSANLGHFGSANWIVVSYFLTYAGFMIVYARLSDVYGRKAPILLAVALFGLFSLGCGLAGGMTSLIILRAFQGMGGSGIYAMVFPVALEVVPLEYFGTFSGVIMAVYASSSILGPLLGGAISSTVSWRWIFLLSKWLSKVDCFPD